MRTTSSLLEEFDVEMCKNVLGKALDIHKNWNWIFKTIVQNNLFILPVDDEFRWLRYHHLFRDFLQSKLLESNPDAAEKIIGSRKGGCPPFRYDGLHGPVRKPLDGHQTAADLPVPSGQRNAALRDSRGENGKSQAPGFRNIGKGGIKSALVADHRGHEFGGPVGF